MHSYQKRLIRQGQNFEDSSFSLNYRKQRKIKRKTHKRKVTKILHTICIAIRKINGQIQKVYFQKTINTFERDREAIQKMTKNSLESHLKKSLLKYEEISDKNQCEKIERKEEIIPGQNTITWQQMNFLMLQNQSNWHGFPIIFQY